MSEDTKSTTKTKSSESSTADSASKSDSTTTSDSTATSDSTTTSDSASSTSSKSDGGKSSRESVGGSSAVHYGFFSNVKNPKYRSGWDDIWSKESKPKKKKPASAKEPVIVNLDLTDLSIEIQKGIADAARAKLKKSRINYDNRDKAGAITWRIECEVKR
jgi:hypothetical protein